METELINNIVKKQTLITTGFNGISNDMYKQLAALQYSTVSKRIVFIGNGPTQWRAWYKGLDLMLSAFSDLIDKGHDLNFDIAGTWDEELLCKEISTENRKRIKFVGEIDDVGVFLHDASLYLHTARGEAWGLAINEAMAAGVIPIVSEWTGAQEMVVQVSDKLVVSVDKESIAERITWFFSLDDSTRLEMSARCREVSTEYNAEAAIDKFVENFQIIRKQLALNS